MANKTRRTRKAPATSRPSGTVYAPQVRGKIVKSVYVCADLDLNLVNIDFTDNTALAVHLYPAARLRMEYSDWSTGDERRLKTWPPLITR